MKKAFLLVVILFVSIISTACINNLAVQQLNSKAKDYLDKGDYDNAISRLKSSIDLDSTIFETHYNLGIAYTQAERYPEAVATFENAIKIRPAFADTYYSLAVAEENYANGIIEGTLKKEGNVSEQKPQTSAIIPGKKVLTTDEKIRVAQLINDSINSYTIYIQKTTNEEEKQQIQQKIEYLKTQLKVYSIPTQS